MRAACQPTTRVLLDAVAVAVLGMASWVVGIAEAGKGEKRSPAVEIATGSNRNEEGLRIVISSAQCPCAFGAISADSPECPQAQTWGTH